MRKVRKICEKKNRRKAAESKKSEERKPKAVHHAVKFLHQKVKLNYRLLIRKCEYISDNEKDESGDNRKRIKFMGRCQIVRDTREDLKKLFNKNSLKRSPGKNSEWRLSNFLDIRSSKTSESIMENSNLTFDTSRNLQFDTEGVKYLIMRRVESAETMVKISPFLLQKCVDLIAGSKVEEVKKLGNGTVLIKTKNVDQARKLRKLATLNPEVQVEIVEHPKLNCSIGVVRMRDFKYMSEEEILDELADQKVTKIHRVTRVVNGEKAETGTYFLTFQSTQAPEKITCGYEKINVLPYVDEPMRCFKCLRFGHQKMRCKLSSEPICGRCAEPQHLNREKNEKCTQNSYCVNCESVDHGSFDKRCPIYRREYEIARIKVYERVTFGEAQRIYRQNVFQGDRTLAGIVKDAVGSNERKACGCPCLCLTPKEASDPESKEAGTSGEREKFQLQKPAKRKTDLEVTNAARQIETGAKPKTVMIDPCKKTTKNKFASPDSSDVDMEEKDDSIRVSLNMTAEEEKIVQQKINRKIGGDDKQEDEDDEEDEKEKKGNGKRKKLNETDSNDSASLIEPKKKTKKEAKNGKKK